MKKRQRKKFESIDASGVKEIAEMQRYIDNLENALWRMAMFADGKDCPRTMISFAERGSNTEFAINKIYDFIEKQKQ